MGDLTRKEFHLLLPLLLLIFLFGLFPSIILSSLHYSTLLLVISVYDVINLINNINNMFILGIL